MFAMDLKDIKLYLAPRIGLSFGSHKTHAPQVLGTAANTDVYAAMRSAVLSSLQGPVAPTTSSAVAGVNMR